MFTPDWVTETIPVLLMATTLVLLLVPLTMRSELAAVTLVRPEPSPTKRVALTVPETSRLAFGAVVPMPTLPEVAWMTKKGLVKLASVAVPVPMAKLDVL